MDRKERNKLYLFLHSLHPIPYLKNLVLPEEVEQLQTEGYFRSDGQPTQKLWDENAYSEMITEAIIPTLDWSLEEKLAWKYEEQTSEQIILWWYFNSVEKTSLLFKKIERVKPYLNELLQEPTSEALRMAVDNLVEILEAETQKLWNKPHED